MNPLNAAVAVVLLVAAVPAAVMVNTYDYGEAELPDTGDAPDGYL